ncbi:hypothetical protein [Sphingomonas melonis]|uniref:Uncharacterized protein n=1 Tax=Sphingomonas melonis TaxID=152682 RepID=A0A7Y9FL01_9SPHN|nr:hypothetical protein [Sphingomonas melonis]NYD89214.1 hypothetical protein [Sphingomonas melonis]
MADEVDHDRRDIIFKEAGRRAREENLTITRMVEAMRLASFRDYLASVVDLMPTILPSVAESVGLTLPETFQRLRPSAAWPACTGRSVAAPVRKRLPSFAIMGRRWSATLSSNDIHAESPRIGAALLPEAAPTDRIEIVPMGRWLEIVYRKDAFELTTREGAAQLRLEGRLPEVIQSTCVGRRLDEVVDLALLRDQGLVIESVRVLSPYTLLQMRVQGSAVAFPWRN